MMTKNERIKQSRIETRLKRKTQILKIFELKVNCHHTSKEDFKKFNEIFKQAKWIQNDVIASNDVFHYNYKDHRKVINFDKDKNRVERDITIQTGVHQCIIAQVQQDIVNLSKSKKHGNKIGKLKFKSECNFIPLRTGMLKIKSSKRISIPMFKNLCVYGLEQFINIPNYEIANAVLIRKASGIYIHIGVYFPKLNNEYKLKNKNIGLDFGIKTAITTSDGDFFECDKQETEQLKFLQKQLHKKQKGSKRYWKLRNQIRKEYEHISNQKKDVANKIVHKLLSENDIIYFQDEQISKWSKKKHSKKNGKKCGFSFGRQVQSSCLGRVKQKLIDLEKTNRSFKISKWMPTTKFCPKCGCLNTLTLTDRTYVCDCGYTCDRDVHASKNVLLFGSTKRTAECLEQASAEASTSMRLITSRLVSQVEPMKRKQEAYTL